MVVILILIVFLAFLVRAWYRNHYQYWTKRGFVSDGPNFPFDSCSECGTTKTWDEKFDEYYRRFKGNPVAGLFFVSMPALAVYDPDLIQNILVKEFVHFHDRLVYANEKDDPLSAHLFSIEGQKWKNRRAKMSPVFTSGKMKMMFEIVDEIGDKFVKLVEKDLKTSEDLEICEWLARYTTDVIGNIAFGIDCNCLENPETDFRKYGKKLMKAETPFEATKLLFTNSFQNLSRKLGLMFTPKVASDFYLKIFTETLKLRQEKKVVRNDFVQILMQLKENGILNFNEIAAESFLMYFGGFHTSASLMAFILYELSLNPEIQVKLRQEILLSMKIHDGKLTYDLIAEMKYLEMVVNEGLRKYPPTPLVRWCREDYKIPGTELIIPKNTQVTIPLFSLHRDEEFFPDPEKFDPERFNGENIKNIRPFTYLPFGGGPRNCIGARFAMMVTKIAISKLVFKFNFGKSCRTQYPLKFSAKSFVLSPENEEVFLKVQKYMK